MANTICASVIKATAIRLVKLDSCGAPVSGASSAVVVSNGFTKVTASPQYEDGTEYFVRRADGTACLNEMDDPQLKRVDMAIDFCQVDPDALVIITGERLLTASSVTGTGVAFGEGVNGAHWSLELWQKVAGRGACTSGGLQRYVYWAFPNVGRAKVSDLSFELAALTFSVAASTFAASTSWGDGPGTAGPWWESTIQDDEHFLFNITTTAPPTPSCGAVLLT